ncbi:glutamine synthetase family protein [Neptunicoccus cionae]|uniref:Glutamine synthetase n=1 Tax=Neptunicoccus cionae TaxID=2035344 RepID=A0A916QXE6_9RHOB|nr:glutamine synthetase family protein [Amylibacter cionae]GGA18613.1 glutamine synthetase [Amylibacter cionae]
MTTAKMASHWIEQNPDVTSVQAGSYDLNGQLRGKRMPISSLEKVLDGSLRMPLSLAVVDVWGHDVEENALVFESGDGDGLCLATERGVTLSSLGEEPTAFVQLMFANEDGTPFMADPRQALGQVVQEYADRGLTVVVATELEFYVTDPGSDFATSQMSDRISETYATVSLDELDHFEPFLNEVYRQCEEQGVPADAAISENGTGQFEINLNHVPDPLRAADDAMMFKRIVRAVARKHERSATFMAKPFGDRSGSGLHVHFSVLDAEGNNIFANGTEEGSDTLLHAVAGLLDTMPESMAIFAPHLNSYRRFAPMSHAPSAVAWGYENRTVAVRIPGGPDEARRIEHRVSGADANPYLVLATILGAALRGIDRAKMPPAPTVGDGYDPDLSQLPKVWDSAVDAFEQSTLIAEIFDPLLITSFVLAKRQEMAKFAAVVSDFEMRTYVDAV